MKVKKSEKIWMKGILIIVLGCAVIYQFKDLILEGIQEMQKISSGKVIVIIFLSLMYMGLEGCIIMQMAGSYKSTLSLRKCIECAYYCAFLRLATFGSGAGVGEIYYLNKAGIKIAKATSVSLIQYMIQKISIAIYSGFSFLLFYPVVNSYMGSYTKYLLPAVCITIVIAIAIILISVPSKISDGLIKIMEKAAFRCVRWQEKIEKAKEQVEILQESARELLHEKKKLLIVFLLNFLKYTCWYMIPFVLYPSDITLGKSILFTSLTTMLAGVIPVPGGLGALEAVFLILFSPIVSKDRAVSIALLYRFVTTMIPFAFGGIAAWKNHKR